MDAYNNNYVAKQKHQVCYTSSNVRTVMSIDSNDVVMCSHGNNGIALLNHVRVSTHAKYSDQ